MVSLAYRHNQPSKTSFGCDGLPALPVFLDVIGGTIRVQDNFVKEKKRLHHGTMDGNCSTASLVQRYRCRKRLVSIEYGPGSVH